MPHVIIGDAPPLREFYDGYDYWEERRPDGTILQTRGAYLRHDGETMLIEAIAIELAPPVHFFITVESKKGGLTVRCFPHPSPPRSAGVQALVAEVARQVLVYGGQVEKTNLPSS